ncbi:glutathione S-transferase-like protein [Sphingopyxis fribergensis]|uniref:glutathione transferase n=1 Tax=Sphingopyxis fribergensis TaxID=1515612 RepID=A0A0A7PJW0_9SPHN|nr:glutathione S-transferase [Sphingopyxis fribergensis]AJA09528.1 glutathione S-transferase-like protein [Sphingopyxis fribergensis]
MLTVHHLGKSQSERIVWLCEELGIDYRLERYERDPVTMLAPLEYKALHPLGAAPVITDGDLVLAESGAIIDYILARYGDAKLVPSVSDTQFPDYLYWYHFSNATLQALLGRVMMMNRARVAPDNPTLRAISERTAIAMRQTDERVAAVPYLAGEMFTAADVMIGFTLSTMRYFLPMDLAPYPGILAYLGRISSRPAYIAAMQKADPEMKLLLS